MQKSKFVVWKHVVETSIDKEIHKYYPDADVMKSAMWPRGRLVHADGINSLDDPRESILISACDNGACYDEDKFLDLVRDEL